MWPFKKKIPTVSVADAAKRVLEAGVMFIDVRTHAEYKAGHARGAKSYPIEELITPNNTDYLTTFDEVYVICRSGGRSNVAVQQLRDVGVNAIDIKGGTVAWEASLLPMV